MIRLFDGHCDTAYELWKRNEPLRRNTCHISLEKAAALNAYAQVFAFCSYACTGAEAEALLNEPLAVLRREVTQNPQHIAFARTKDDILRTISEGKAAALLSVEGAEVIGCDPDRLARLSEQGFCMTTLTWNADNPLAGCHASDRGLSEQGKDFVRQAQALDILIDVSHLGERAFWDLVDITSKPILASHSNARALLDYTRNLTDDQLRAIADTGGTVGLNLYPPFLGESAGFETLRRHLEHLLRVCGESHVALGGDLDGCDVLADGFSDVASYPSFYRYLSSNGYSDALLERIFFTNLLQLF